MHKIMCLDGWLWYLEGEGKVSREWVYEICRRASIDPFSLQLKVWHEIPIR
jgi:hypothetical protein